MEIERKIIVKLTPDEVRDIIKKHLLGEGIYDIEKIIFNIEKKYSGYGVGESSYHEFTGVNCNGVIKNDSN